MKYFKTFANFLTESMNKPNTIAKDVFRDATDALTKTFGGKNLDKRYVKDYLKSIEQMARKNPGKLVKDYGDFDINDWIEDVEYNLQNESTLTESNKYTVAWSDGVRGGDEFKKKDDAMKYAKDLIRDNKRLQYVSVHRPGMTQTAHREDLLAWWGPGDMWDNKAKKDKTLYDIQIEA